jgi:hypothetical protein
MNEIWERVLANSFSGIHKSKIICSVEQGIYSAILTGALTPYIRRPTLSYAVPATKRLGYATIYMDIGQYIYRGGGCEVIYLQSEHAKLL